MPYFPFLSIRENAIIIAMVTLKPLYIASALLKQYKNASSPNELPVKDTLIKLTQQKQKSNN